LTQSTIGKRRKTPKIDEAELANKAEVSQEELNQKKIAVKETVDIFSKLLHQYSRIKRYQPDNALQSFQIPKVL